MLTLTEFYIRACRQYSMKNVVDKMIFGIHYVYCCVVSYLVGCKLLSGLFVNFSQYSSRGIFVWFSFSCWDSPSASFRFMLMSMEKENITFVFKKAANYFKSGREFLWFFFKHHGGN